jgi:hypothetical protein
VLNIKEFLKISTKLEKVHSPGVKGLNINSGVARKTDGILNLDEGESLP